MGSYNRLSHYFILVASFVPLVFAFCFATSAATSPAVGTAAIPAALTLGMVSMLGASVFLTLASQEARLRKLEDQRADGSRTKPS